MYNLDQAQAQLDAWLAASLAIASNQSYTIESGGTRRQLTRADASEVLAHIKHWSAEVSRLTVGATGRRRTRYVVPE